LRHVFLLMVLFVAAGWSAAEVELGPEPSRRADEPEWRRTSQGWVKVGGAGPAALQDRPVKPAAEPSLHPGVVAAFLFCCGLLSLLAFERRPGAWGASPMRSSAERPMTVSPEAMQQLSQRACDLVNPHKM
jgi:hypothetical protein